MDVCEGLKKQEARPQERFLVDAKELWEIVGNGNYLSFYGWFTWRCKKGGFQENEDYIMEQIPKNRAIVRKEYYMTLDMAWGFLKLIPVKGAKYKAGREYLQRIESGKAPLPSLRKQAALPGVPQPVEIKLETARNNKLCLIEKLNALEGVIGISKRWKSVRDLPWVRDYFKITEDTDLFEWLERSADLLSKMLGYQVRMDDELSKARRYHVDVLNALKIKVENNDNFLRVYRK